MFSADNEFSDYFVTIGIGIAVFVVTKIALKIVCSQLGKISKRTDTIMDDLLVDALQDTKGLLVVLFSFWIGTEWLELGRAELWLDRFGFFVVVLQGGVWVSSFIVGGIKHYGEKRLWNGQLARLGR